MTIIDSLALGVLASAAALLAILALVQASKAERWGTFLLFVFGAVGLAVAVLVVARP